MSYTQEELILAESNAESDRHDHRREIEIARKIKHATWLRRLSIGGLIYLAICIILLLNNGKEWLHIAVMATILTLATFSQTSEINRLKKPQKSAV
nr:putative integron gene cassette protein [uncultured bacterium]